MARRQCWRTGKRAGREGYLSGLLAGGCLVGILIPVMILVVRTLDVPPPFALVASSDEAPMLERAAPRLVSSEPVANAALTAQSAPDSVETSLEPRGTERRFPVTIQRPEGPPRVATGELDFLGDPVTVSCASCHANLPSQPATRAGEDLTEFHQGLRFHHGQLSCLTCHHPDDYNQLRRSDGSFLEYPQVQLLCAQCHIPQARDYEHGAHGGMLGYWDLTRGPRHRKGCIDCHDPHAPAFPRMIPDFKSRDRFLDQRRDGVDHE